MVDSKHTRNIEALDMSKIISYDIIRNGSLPADLEIIVGVKKILKSNFDVKKGLANSSVRFITETHWPSFRRAQMYEQDISQVI